MTNLRFPKTWGRGGRQRGTQYRVSMLMVTNTQWNPCHIWGINDVPGFLRPRLVEWCVLLVDLRFIMNAHRTGIGTKQRLGRSGHIWLKVLRSFLQRLPRHRSKTEAKPNFAVPFRHIPHERTLHFHSAAINFMCIYTHRFVSLIRNKRKRPTLMKNHNDIPSI